MTRRYRITRTLMGWMVMTTDTEAYTFADTHAAALEKVAKFEVARLGGWEWWPYTDPNGVLLLVNSHTGQTRRFRNHQQAAVFLTALQQHRKTNA